ncbi:MAG: sigma-54 dependent transcriptional regulator [Nitrospiraceae bacterium]|nr:sigma-54 dependent transcriptional regulator [Nitrospiraceae bacterium]
MNGKPDKDKASILVVEDEQHMREILKMLLETEGYSVFTAATGTEGANSLEKDIFDLVITDIKMPGLDGFGVLRKALDVSPQTAVIMITAFGTTESAIEAMKLGAYDYIHKPFKIDEIRIIIRKALEKQKLQKEVSILKKIAVPQLENIVARSPKMKEILRILPRIAESKANVLVTGESGTGKELIANALHSLSDRRDAGFVAINCASLPEGLLESELFGYMRGAFTGAAQNKQGLFEMAHKGTLFLDEIAEMPIQLQSKLLRAIETGTFRRLGGTADISVDLRIVSATNKDMKEAVRDGLFRGDLFYRLGAIPVHLPPLRERMEDIPAIIEHILRQRGSKAQFTKKAMEIMMGRQWNGNVRELENILERILLFAEGDVITENDVPPDLNDMQPAGSGLLEIGGDFNLERLIEGLEKDYLLKALSQTGGHKTEAAALLGLSFRSFRHRLAKYGIK